MVKVFHPLPNGKPYVSIDGYLLELYKVYRDAVRNHNTSVVILIDGKSGRGKSTLAMQSAIVLDKNFDLPQVYYNPHDFLEGLAQAKPYSCHVFDEAMVISNRSVMSEINRMVIQAMSMIRSKRLYVIFCINSIFDMDRNLVLSRADLLLHVYSESLVDRGRFCAYFQAKDGQDRLKDLYILGRKFYTYSRPKSNFYGSFTSEFVVNQEEYEKRKQSGVNAFLTKSGGDRVPKALESRNKLINSLIDKEGYSVKEVAEMSGLEIQAIYMMRRKKENEFV